VANSMLHLQGVCKQAYASDYLEGAVGALVLLLVNGRSKSFTPVINSCERFNMTLDWQ